MEAAATGDWGMILEKGFSWVSKILIGVLTWQAIQLTDTINNSSMQIMKLGSDQEIMRHDIQSIQKDLEKIQYSVEKLNDRK